MVRVPRCWHACRPQTVHLYRDGGALTGILYCSCGAVTDHTGRWVGRNSRRSGSDSVGLRREAATSQPHQARVAAGASSHSGARSHARPHRARRA